MNIEVILGKQTYRITAPDSAAVIVERQVTVDPTKSPAFDPAKHSAELRQEYREPKYYSTVEAALKSLLDRVARHSEAETLSELLLELHDYKRVIRRLMSVEGN